MSIILLKSYRTNISFMCIANLKSYVISKAYLYTRKIAIEVSN